MLKIDEWEILLKPKLFDLIKNIQNKNENKLNLINNNILEKNKKINNLEKKINNLENKLTNIEQNLKVLNNKNNQILSYLKENRNIYSNLLKKIDDNTEKIEKCFNDAFYKARLSNRLWRMYNKK